MQRKVPLSNGEVLQQKWYKIVCTAKFCFKCGTACLSYAFLKEFLIIFLPEFKALFKALQKLTTCHTKLIAVMLCDEHGNVVSQINGFEKKR